MNRTSSIFLREICEPWGSLIAQYILYEQLIFAVCRPFPNIAEKFP
jgi:hypothetical protein